MSQILSTKIKKVFISIIAFFIFINLFTIKSQANFDNLTGIDERYTIQQNQNNIFSPYQVMYDREETYREKILNKMATYGATLKSEYDLRDYIDITVKNQGDTWRCWIYSINSAIETNLAKTQEIVTRFDEEYTDIKTESIYEKSSLIGGNNLISLGFYTSGAGPKNLNDNKIEYEVEDYIMFPSINKIKNGTTTKYYDASGIELTSTQLKEIRDSIKSHIVNYGAVTGVTYTEGKEFFSNQSNLAASQAYYCDNSAKSGDHQITIIGWDDNYPITNFNPEHRPSTPGAYIVLNSYGEDMFDNGYIYISYEDLLIENNVVGVKKSNKIDHSTIYQHDELGMNNGIGKATLDTLYAANVFTRTNKNELENLTEISVANLISCSYEIYVNSSDGTLNSNKLQKVKTTGKLEAGYHTIELDNPITLNGEKFAIAIKCVRINWRNLYRNRRSKWNILVKC